MKSAFLGIFVAISSATSLKEGVNPSLAVSTVSIVLEILTIIIFNLPLFLD